jgi:pimeloyl-ACP methyl ester carboxylesterase
MKKLEESFGLTSQKGILPFVDDHPETWLHSIKNRALAIVREVRPLFLENLNKGLRLMSKNMCVCNTSFDHEWRANNEGLYLLIHGLLGQPLIWNCHYQKLKNLHPEAEIRAPAVPSTGNCSLEEAAAPFLALVRDYVDKNPGNPVCLIGHSNGSRIASYIEVLLRERNVNIMVSSVSGIYQGTSVINRLAHYHIASCFLDQKVVEEMSYKSAYSRFFLGSMNTTHIKDGSLRVYHFYTTRQDAAVEPYTAACPMMTHPLCTSQYTILSGYGHNGLVRRICDEQSEECVNWVKNHRSKP